MQNSTFYFHLQDCRPQDADLLAEQVRQYFNDHFRSYLAGISASYSPVMHTPNWVAQSVTACTTIQIRAALNDNRIELSLSSGELAAHFQLAQADTLTLWLNQLCEKAWPYRTWNLALTSPGFDTFKAAKELLPPPIHDFTQYNKGRASIYKVMRIGLIGAFATAIIFPAIIAFQIYRGVQARVDQVNGVVTDLTNTVTSQGARLEKLYNAGADALNWTGVKDQVSGWISGDSTETK